MELSVSEVDLDCGRLVFGDDAPESWLNVCYQGSHPITRGGRRNKRTRGAWVVMELMRLRGLRGQCPLIL